MIYEKPDNSPHGHGGPITWLNLSHPDTPAALICSFIGIHSYWFVCQIEGSVSLYASLLCSLSLPHLLSRVQQQTAKAELVTVFFNVWLPYGVVTKALKTVK